MSGSELAARVHAAVADLEPGEVVTYGEHADVLLDHARAVGAAMRTCPEGLPWWRVVPASGRLPDHLVTRQAPLLVAEGVAVVDGRVLAGGR